MKIPTNSAMSLPFVLTVLYILRGISIPFARRRLDLHNRSGAQFRLISGAGGIRQPSLDNYENKVLTGFITRSHHMA